MQSSSSEVWLLLLVSDSEPSSTLASATLLQGVKWRVTPRALGRAPFLCTPFLFSCAHGGRVRIVFEGGPRRRGSVYPPPPPGPTCSVLVWNSLSSSSVRGRKLSSFSGYSCQPMAFSNLGRYNSQPPSVCVCVYTRLCVCVHPHRCSASRELDRCSVSESLREYNRPFSWQTSSL